MAMPPRARRRGVRRLTAALGAIAVSVLIWLAGLFVFAGSIPSAVADAEAETDAIVVLTGGSGRLEEGLTLLSQKRAQKLFVSGVYQGVDVEKLLELSRRHPEELSCCIILGYAAGSTAGNATETAEWLESEGFTSIRLVTASYHMPRSLIEFRHVMPEIAIVPHAVFPPQFKHDGWWRWPGTAQLILMEYLKFIAARLRHAADNVVGS